ncbi:hypothetical protein EHQ16_05310 [Leptospira kanakyensis]|uniref:Uncharacterized protein n=1 Tax=Leptospira kanakyensis TaxID=2484968 RepID=A0A6N4QER8_9LEPT|nr:hypothetical protein [Leptospira kanakyensis]TGK50535.1 hypothetical protein EHQ11_12710 [Leptospira kanakyensis]TGK63864.1 hypothetical protein EHQ16_05310 [Leptospira kanakyensis]TGK69673.1 hypothetical protein EHQ18_12870 [Leptospira kanakyensis]
MIFKNNELEEAVTLYVGWGKNIHPSIDENLLIQKYGKDLGSKYLAKIRTLKHDFYKTDAFDKANNTTEMGRMAIAQFRKLHPEIGLKIAELFAWCYTFDNK